MIFDDIISIKNSEKRKNKLNEWYRNEVKVCDWLTKPFKNSIIIFYDRVEYKKNDKYHRLNGPAIEFTGYKNTKPIKNEIYYYNGEKFENKKEWEKVTKKELRKLKLKKINKI